MSGVEVPETINQELKVRSKQWERANRYQLVRCAQGGEDWVIGSNLTAEAAKALAVKLSKYSTEANFVIKAQIPDNLPAP